MFATGYTKIDNDILTYEIPTASQVNLQTERTILIAVDESLTAQFAFRYAIDNVIRPTDQICIANVMPTNSPPPLESLDAGAMFIDTGYLDKQQVYNQHHSEWLLQQYELLLKGHKVRLFCLIGDNRDEICRAAVNLKSDLVVLGSRDLSGVHRMFLGSTSDYCIHNLDCPVFVVKPPESKEITPLLKLGSNDTKLSKSD